MMLARIEFRLRSCLLAAFVLLFAAVVDEVSAQQTAGAYKTSYRFNLLGQPTGVIRPDSDDSASAGHLATRYSYDLAGSLVQIEEGRLGLYQTDSIKPSDWSGFTVHRKVIYTYDDLGRRLTESIADASGNRQTLTQFTYDSENRVRCKALRMNPGAYDSLPSSACTLGVEGDFGPDRITRFTYGGEGYGKVTREERAVGTPLQQVYVQYGYDSLRRINGITDANGNYTHQTYDSNSRLQRVYYPSKTTTGSYSPTDYEQYGYDNNGNRTSVRKRDGRIVYYGYDALNRIIFKNAPAPSQDSYYDYDHFGQRLYARFGSKYGLGITDSYSGFGEHASSSSNLVGTTRNLSYGYDKAGNRNRITYPDGRYFTYVYDGLDRVTGVKEAAYTTVVTAAYDLQGRTNSIVRAGGARTDYDYDGISRLEGLSQDFYGTLDDVVYSFGFNPANQMIRRETDNDKFVYGEHAYEQESFGVNGLNQYTSVAGDAFAYDNNGNLSSDSASSYIYDVENRLTSVNGAQNATLKYDPVGRLYEMTGDGVTRRFLYDGNALVAEYDTSGYLTKRYLHSPRQDKPLLEYDGSTVGSATRRYLHTDFRGSVIARSDSNGRTVDTNSYDAYGIADSQNAGRFSYTGQLAISGTDLYHFKARAYSPAIGRFLQTDPIGFDDQFNLYAYVANDPINLIDPSGLAQACTEVIDEDGNVVSKICIEIGERPDPPKAGVSFHSFIDNPGSFYQFQHYERLQREAYADRLQCELDQAPKECTDERDEDLADQEELLFGQLGNCAGANPGPSYLVAYGMCQVASVDVYRRMHNKITERANSCIVDRCEAEYRQTLQELKINYGYDDE